MSVAVVLVVLVDILEMVAESEEFLGVAMGRVIVAVCRIGLTLVVTVLRHGTPPHVGVQLDGMSKNILAHTLDVCQ